MTHIVGFGGYVPERVMTNDEWASLVDTTDEWITQRTGIKRRRIAAPDESTPTLAGNAARMAIEDAGLTPDDIDETTVATDTPEIGWLDPTQHYELVIDRIQDWVAFTPLQNASGEPI